MNGKIRQSLRSSIYDGICASAAGSVIDNFILPLAIALQASASQIASLASLPGLIGAAVQLQAGPLMNRWGRKTLMLAGVALQAACILGLVSFYWIPAAARVPVTIILMIVFTGAGAVAGPMWGSLMCEYLPFRRRSGYFGWRSRFLGGVTIVATFAGGLLLQVTGRHNLRGFLIILLVAALVRVVSLRFLNQMHEPPPTGKRPLESPTYRSCLRQNRPFMRFIVAEGLMGVCVNLSGPFLTLYMLKDLGLSYVVYTALLIAAQATMYWMMGRWGRSADRAGNMKVIQLTVRFLPFTALLWIFSTNVYYLLAVQLFSGIVWAGYNLCVGNFVYDSVRNEQRVHATALFSSVNGLAAFAGATLGGILLTHLPPLGGRRFYSLVILAAAARFLVGWFVFPRLREVRQVPHTRNRKLAYNLLGLKLTDDLS